MNEILTERARQIHTDTQRFGKHLAIRLIEVRLKMMRDEGIAYGLEQAKRNNTIIQHSIQKEFI